MPFSDTEHGSEGSREKITAEQWTHIYNHWIKKALESYQSEKIICKRSSAKPGNFVKGIVADLDSSALVVADLTGAKPNVYYELGIRHALRTGTIIITQDFNALPSDLRGYYVFEYTYSEKAHEYEEYYAKFEKKMHETIQALSDSDDTSDSPVSDFLGIIHQRVEKELQKEKEELKYILNKLKEHFTHNFEVCELILSYMKGGKQQETERLAVIDVFAIDTVYLRLIAYNWNHMKCDALDMLEKIVIRQRRLFNEISIIWTALHANTEQSELANSLFQLLEASSEEKKRFYEYWDANVGGAVDAIKLVKRGKKN